MASSSDDLLEEAPSKLKVEKYRCSNAHVIPYVLSR